MTTAPIAPAAARPVRAAALVLPLALSLAACGSDADRDGDGHISADEVRAELKDGGPAKMQPGEWEQRIRFSDLDLPGVPEGMREAIGRELGQGVVVRHCLTRAQVDRPDPQFFQGGSHGDCEYRDFKRSGDRIALRMTCTAPGMASPAVGTAEIAMDGTFGKDRFSMTIDHRMKGGAMGEMRMKGAIAGKRIGECADRGTGAPAPAG